MLTDMKLYVQQTRMQRKLVVRDRECEDELPTVTVIIILIKKEYMNQLDIVQRVKTIYGWFSGIDGTGGVI